MSSHNDSFVASGNSPTEPDFFCENHGSTFLLRPISPAAFDWIDSHLCSDRHVFGNAVAIETRFVWPILLGIPTKKLTAAQCEMVKRTLLALLRLAEADAKARKERVN